MKKEELNILLGEWAGVAHFHLSFTESLRDCIQWLFPRISEKPEVRFRKGDPYINSISCEIHTYITPHGIQVAEAYLEVETWSNYDQLCAEVFCLALHELIERRKEAGE